MDPRPTRDSPYSADSVDSGKASPRHHVMTAVERADGAAVLAAAVDPTAGHEDPAAAP
ncbi:hypothetical protein [Streptomyces cellulosae]|uniref:hypothetical protein n=1 Tax=Streptomyces cellulosae TaxID=1968 RepID=UPI000AE920BC|nr:hypothetical protein [Streptomyces cellulosae]